MKPSRTLSALVFSLVGFGPAIVRAQQGLEDVERLYGERRYEEAYAAARQVAAAAPRNEKALFWLGVSAQLVGRSDEARKAFLKAVGIKPDYAEALNNVGDIFEREKNWAMAVEYYQKAIQANPKLAAPRAGLGDVYRRNGAWAKAAEHYESALRLNPGDSVSQRYLDACRQALKEESEGTIRAGTLRALSTPADARGQAGQIRLRGFSGQTAEEPVEPRRLALHIGFARNQYVVEKLPAKARAQLEEVASLLRSDDWKGKKLTIEGHTCSCGSSKTNEELGRKRAEGILQFLVEKRAVGAEAVRIVSFGKQRPVMPSSESDLAAAACERNEAHSMNRRVVIQEGWPAGNPKEYRPLVKVSFWQRPSTNSEYRPLVNGAALRSGQQVKIVMEASQTAYAYVLHRGPDNKWAVLFPNPEFSREAPAQNPVEPGRSYSLPGKKMGLVLDDQPGTEETLVYASPEADPDLDGLVAKLLRGEAVKVVAPPRPPRPAVKREPAVKPGAPRPVVSEPEPPKTAAPESETTEKAAEGVVDIITRGIKGVAVDDSDIVRLPVRPAARLSFQHRP